MARAGVINDDVTHTRILLWTRDETPEIFCASQQRTYLVRFQVLPLNGQRHVRERFGVQQLIEHRQQIALVIVPSQTESLRGRHRDRRRSRGRLVVVRLVVLSLRFHRVTTADSRWPRVKPMGVGRFSARRQRVSVESAMERMVVRSAKRRETFVNIVVLVYM